MGLWCQCFFPLVCDHLRLEYCDIYCKDYKPKMCLHWRTLQRLWRSLLYKLRYGVENYSYYVASVVSTFQSVHCAYTHTHTIVSDFIQQLVNWLVSAHDCPCVAELFAEHTKFQL